MFLVKNSFSGRHGVILKGKKLWQGAVYLSVAAIIIKILSAIYRVPYQNIAGDIGFYVYQQIYPIYGIAIMLSTFGFPVIISKLIAERRGQFQDVMKNAFVSLTTVSLFVFILFFINAPFLSSMMGDDQLLLPLQTVSFIFIIIPMLAILRGFFQGQDEMLPTALSQVAEQFSRVCAILLFTYFFIANGFGPYAAGAGAALGSIVGGFIGFCVLLYFFKKEGISLKAYCEAKISFSLMKTILFHGVLICFSSLVLLLFQLVDALTILRVLSENGINHEMAKVAKGVYDRGQPLIQMGTVITTSFSLVVVPLIAKVAMEGRRDLIQTYSSLALRVSLIIGAAASVGLAVIIEPTNIMLFKDQANSLVLAVLGFSIVFTSIFLTTSAILHGLNKIHVTVSHVFIGVTVKVLLNIILLPIYGTLGAAIATVLACSICASLNYVALRKLNALPNISVLAGVNIVKALIGLALITFLWKQGSYYVLIDEVSTRLSYTFVAASSVGVGAITFLFFIVRNNVFTKEEIEHLPKGRKLAVFMQRVNKK